MGALGVHHKALPCPVSPETLCGPPGSAHSLLLPAADRGFCRALLACAQRMLPGQMWNSIKEHLAAGEWTRCRLQAPAVLTASP